MKKFIFIVLIIIFIHDLNAIDVKFGWSIGDIGMYYNVIGNSFNAHIELLRFNWILENGIGIGFTSLEMQNVNDYQISKYSLMPIEISYSPINYDNLLYLSIYGRIGWQFRQDAASNNRFNFFSSENSFYGAIGTKLFMFPAFKLHYSGYMALFIEYNTFNELKVGFSLDILALIIGGLTGWREGIEKDRVNEWEKPDLKINSSSRQTGFFVTELVPKPGWFWNKLIY
jgi:hypothetical protein